MDEALDAKATMFREYELCELLIHMERTAKLAPWSEHLADNIQDWSKNCEN
jgi:hypothetical protein